MNPFKTAVRVFVFMTVLTGLVYPLLVTAIAALTMPKLANGSLVKKGEQVIGSRLIAQNMRDSDRYFWPRPSAIDYDPLKPSGGSNLGPTSQKLKQIVTERREKVGAQAPLELLFASGSGLDPHISLKTAYFQIPRIAKSRSMNEIDLKNLVDRLSEGFGFLGTGYVNVFSLNQALDETK